MERGMIFDLYQEGQPVKRVLALSEKDVICLNDNSLIYGIDFQNEVEEILIDNIFTYPFS